MLTNLFFTLNAVMPIVLVIAVGYFLKSIRLFDEKFFPLLNKLCFRCCLPCLLFFNVYNVENISEISRYGKICAFAVISILIFFTAAVFIIKHTVSDDRQKGVMIQASYRSNYAIIGLSLAMSISNGDSGPVVAASILSSVSIPLFNVLAIIALSLFVSEDGKKVSVLSIIKKNCDEPAHFGRSCGHFVPCHQIFHSDFARWNKNFHDKTESSVRVQDNRDVGGHCQHDCAHCVGRKFHVQRDFSTQIQNHRGRFGTHGHLPARLSHCRLQSGILIFGISCVDCAVRHAPRRIDRSDDR